MSDQDIKDASNHPLSIEAVFPTDASLAKCPWCDSVTILCQSRLFFPQEIRGPLMCCLNCNHPLSIEAIFPTF